LYAERLSVDHRPGPERENVTEITGIAKIARIAKIAEIGRWYLGYLVFSTWYLALSQKSRPV
jgi:hypothetical protein